MREFQERKRFKHLLFSKGMVVVLAVLVVFFARSTFKLYLKEQESAANALIAKNELAKLENRQKLLNSEIERLNTEEGIEAEIRSKYNVSKPGENLVIIVDKEEGEIAPVQEPESWWGKFKKIFNR